MSSADSGTKSKLIEAATGIPIFQKLIGFIEGAGAKSEEDTKRDGFVSHKAESHALSAGLGIGFTATSTNNLKLIGVAYEAVLFTNRGKKIFGPDLLKDIKQELQYFFAGIVAGAVIGLATRVYYGLELPTLPVS